MLNESKPPITLAELVELQDLELSVRGETRDDVTRSIRSRLEELRAGRGNRLHIGRPPLRTMETKMAALEEEVAHLRALIDGGRN